MRHTVKVILWGEEIGTLTSDVDNAYFYFKKGISERSRKAFPIGISKMILNGDSPLLGDDNPPYNGTPHFISDSLPDAWGNELFEQWRTARHISKRQISPCDKLAFIGIRGMGALEFKPDETISVKNDPVDLRAIVDLAEKILEEREDAILTPDEELTMRSLIAIGSSVGGRQAKALLAIDRHSGVTRSGQIAGLKNHDYYIIKFNIPERDSAEIEYLYYRLATAAGIKMMESKLIKIDGINHFMTQRFDRDEDGNKIHIQTLAALLSNANSYEDLLSVCRELSRDYESQEQIFIRMVFNILANNTDDHHRNFSFMMDRTGKWSLSPAYDITFIFDEGGWQGNQKHCITANGQRSYISKEDVIAIAYANNIQNPEALIDKVSTVLYHFREYADNSGIREEFLARIADTIDSNLEHWGLIEPQKPLSFITDGNISVTNAHIEMAYRTGNFHLLAEIDGIPKKYVITKKHPLYSKLLKRGIRNASEADIQQLIKHLTLPR